MKMNDKVKLKKGNRWKDEAKKKKKIKIKEQENKRDEE